MSRHASSFSASPGVTAEAPEPGMAGEDSDPERPGAGRRGALRGVQGRVKSSRLSASVAALVALTGMVSGCAWPGHDNTADAAATRDPRWTARLPDGFTARTAALSSGVVVVTGHTTREDDAVVAVSASNGRQLWKRGAGELSGRPLAAVTKNAVVYGQLASWEDTGSEPATTTVYDLRTGRARFLTTGSLAVTPDAVISTNCHTVDLDAERCVIRSRDLSTGDVRWQRRLSNPAHVTAPRDASLGAHGADPGLGVGATGLHWPGDVKVLLAHHGLLQPRTTVINTETGDTVTHVPYTHAKGLYRAYAEDPYRDLGAAGNTVLDIDHTTRSTTPCGKTLRAYQLPSGRELWRREIDNPVPALGCDDGIYRLLSGGRLLTGTGHGQAQLLDPTTGEQLWRGPHGADYLTAGPHTTVLATAT
ncbi:MAG: PQQ-binding-like beta-propeller repeat protein, partial [Micromonosporaceae bacterium]